MKPAQMLVSLKEDCNGTKDKPSEQQRQIRLHEIGEATMKPDRVRSTITVKASKVCKCICICIVFTEFLSYFLG